MQVPETLPFGACLVLILKRVTFTKRSTGHRKRNTEPLLKDRIHGELIPILNGRKMGPHLS